MQLFSKLAAYLYFAVRHSLLDFAARLLDHLVCFPTHLYNQAPQLFAALQSLGNPYVMQQFMCAAANRDKARVAYCNVEKVFGNLANQEAPTLAVALFHNELSEDNEVDVGVEGLETLHTECGGSA